MISLIDKKYIVTSYIYGNYNPIASAISKYLSYYFDSSDIE